MKQVDYDQTEISEQYDKARSYGPGILDFWIDKVVHVVPVGTVRTILDLGCGTGRFGPALSARYRAEVYGVDPSRRMLGHARAKCDGMAGVFLEGIAEKIPVPSDSIDLIFISDAWHHFDDAQSAAAECLRVLRSRGRIVVRNSTAENILKATVFADFFPSYSATARTYLPTVAAIVGTLGNAGLVLRSHEVFLHPFSAHWRDFAERTSLKADSILARLPPEEFQSGLAKLRKYAEQRNDVERLALPIDLFCFEKAS